MTALTNKQRTAACYKRRAEQGIVRKEYWATESEHKKLAVELKQIRKLTRDNEIMVYKCYLTRL